MISIATEPRLSANGTAATEEDGSRHRLECLQVSRDISRALLSTESIVDAMQRCGEVVRRATDVEFVGVWTICPQSAKLLLQGKAFAPGSVFDTLPIESAVVSEATLIGKTCFRQSAIFVEDAGDAAVADDLAFRFPPGRFGLIAVPVVLDGICFGVLAVLDRSSRGQLLVAQLWSAANEIACHYDVLHTRDRARVREQFFFSQYHSSPLPILCVDTGGHVTMWNTAAQRLLGWSREQIVGRKVAFITEGSSVRFKACLSQAIVEGRTCEDEVTAGRQDGGDVELRIVAVPCFGDDIAVEQVSLFLFDRSREIALAQAVKAQISAATVLSSPSALELAAQSVLQSVCESFGWSRGEYWKCNSSTAEADRVALWTVGEIASSESSQSSTESSLSFNDELIRRVRTSREPVWLPEIETYSASQHAMSLARTGLSDAIGAPVFDQDEVIGVTLFFGNELSKPDALTMTALSTITRQVSQFVRAKETEVALKIAEENRQQEQKMEAIGHLAGGIAHDFNNILTVILGHAELAREVVGEQSEVAPLLWEVENSALRAAGLTRQLLAFSRKQHLEPIVLDVNGCVQNLDKMLSRLVGDNIVLQKELADGLHHVYADPARVEQIVLNLVVNARDAIPEGGRVVVRTSNVDVDSRTAASHPDATPGEYVALAVSDNGCGMDETTQKRIFEPFFTTKPVGKGTGMGLATVFGIVKQSGGFLAVESQLGVGSTFTVYLPRTRAALAAMKIDGPLTAPPTGTETILLAEDDPVVRALVQQILGRCGYRVLVSESGNDALEQFSQHREDIRLLLTDVVMPEMNGPQLAKAIQAVRSDVKVLFMSGYSDSELLRTEVHAKNRMLVQKPFTSAQLATKVREALDHPTSSGLA